MPRIPAIAKIKIKKDLKNERLIPELESNQNLISIISQIKHNISLKTNVNVLIANYYP